MNIRKPADYSRMFSALAQIMAADLPQTELYTGIGRLVCARPEKGAAVMAAEYLSARYPDATGFSPRNLRRMRLFCQIYADAPEVLQQAMEIGWTQNVVILEAGPTVSEKAWYIQAVWRLGWTKAELLRQIESGAHLLDPLDFAEEVYYTTDKVTAEGGRRENGHKQFSNQCSDWPGSRSWASGTCCWTRPR